MQRERNGRAQLASWAAGNLPGLIEKACADIAARVPAYYGDQAGQIVSLAELKRSVAHNLRSMVSALGRPQAPFDFTAPENTGRRRAQQNVPLPEVLRAYRLSFAALWNGMVDYVHHTRQPALTDSLIGTASLLWELTDEHAVALTEAYRAMTAEMLLAQQRRRGAVVEALLYGRPGPESGPWEAAALLGFAPDSSLIVVVAETRGLAEESMPNVEQRLAERRIVSGWRLTPAQQMGIVSFQPEDLDDVLQALRELATARTGVSPAYRALPDTPRALRLAQAALAGMRPGEVGVHTFDQSPLAALMVSEPTEGRRLAQQVLGGVLQQPSEDRDLLLQTLAAYLDNAGSAERSADVLYCHPNTVRNRLRRIQELTGRSLSDPIEVAELTTASYALRLETVTTLVSGSPGSVPRNRAMIHRPTDSPDR